MKTLPSPLAQSEHNRTSTARTTTATTGHSKIGQQRPRLDKRAQTGAQSSQKEGNTENSSELIVYIIF